MPAPARLPARRKKLVALSAAAVLAIIGIVVGALVVSGSQLSRLAGVNHLYALGWVCKSVFQEGTYYQSECIHGTAPSSEDIGYNYEDDEFRDEETQERMLGEYPWIWSTEEPTTHLAQAGSRLRILSWDNYEPVIQFDFASGPLAIDGSKVWLLNDGQGNAWPHFPAEADAVCADGEGDILPAAAVSTLAVDKGEEGSEMAVVTIDFDARSTAESPEAYCIELHYSEDGGVSRQSQWVRFVLPLDEISAQVEERLEAGELDELPDSSATEEALEVHFSSLARFERLRSIKQQNSWAAAGDELPDDEDDEGDQDDGDAYEGEDGETVSEDDACFLEADSVTDCPPKERDYYDGSYVEIEDVTVDLPEGWDDFSRRQKEIANPYGCWRRSSIDDQTGRCLDYGYELFGYEGTPDWLTVRLPAYLEEAEEQIDVEYGEGLLREINPYGCLEFEAIDDQTSRCSFGRWSIWGYVYGGYGGPAYDEEDYDEEYEEATPDWRGATLHVQTFENENDKEAYFTANPERHPCQAIVAGSSHYAIAGQLYVIYADETDPASLSALWYLFNTGKFEELDPEAVLHDSLSCPTRLSELAAQALLCQKNGSTAGVCASAGLSSRILEEVEAVGRTCQAVYDNIELRRADRPHLDDLADCLLLTDELRQDFLKTAQVVVEGDEYWLLAVFGGGGVYDPVGSQLPYVAWDGQTELGLYGHHTRFQFESGLLHEYLHKFYARDLPLKQRMRFHQEMLALYEDRRKLVFGYLGPSSLRDEVGSRAARHGRVSLTQIDDIIDDINVLAPQIIAQLPRETRLEYDEFLQDRHGIVAFVYALTEEQINDDGLRYDKDLGQVTGERIFAEVIDLKFADEFDAIVAEANSQLGDDPLLPPSFAYSLSRIMPSLGYSSVYSSPSAAGETEETEETEEQPADEEDTVEPEEPEDIEDELEEMLEDVLEELLALERPGASWRFDFIHSALSGFFIEGYPILALETAHPLSDWLEDHYGRYFDRPRLTRYFQYHPPLVYEPLPVQAINSRRTAEVLAVKDQLEDFFGDGRYWPTRIEFNRRILGQLELYIYGYNRNPSVVPGSPDSRTEEGTVEYTDAMVGQRTQAGLDADLLSGDIHYPGPDELHVIAGVECKEGGLLAGGNPSLDGTAEYVTGDLLLAPRAAAIIYQLEGETQARCADNT